MKILPCPCCGGNAYPVYRVNGSCICCSECGLKTSWYEYIQDAVKAWNKRVPIADEYEIYG